MCLVLFFCWGKQDKVPAFKELTFWWHSNSGSYWFEGNLSKMELRMPGIGKNLHQLLIMQKRNGKSLQVPFFFLSNRESADRSMKLLKVDNRFCIMMHFPADPQLFSNAQIILQPKKTLNKSSKIIFHDTNPKCQTKRIKWFFSYTLLGYLSNLKT